MNILILAEVSASSVTSGSERVLEKQAKGLKSKGHHVDLLVRAPSPDADDQMVLGDITEFRYPVRRTSAPAFVCSSIRESLRMFDKLMEKNRYDTVIIHQALAGLGPVMFRLKVCRNWTYVCHSLAHEEYRARNPGSTLSVHAKLRLWIEGIVLRRCSSVVVLSEFTKERIMVNHRIPANKISIIPGAADLLTFKPADDKKTVRAGLNLPQDKIILLSIRNLDPRMGLENLIKAMAEVRKTDENILLLIGGEGPRKTQLQQLIDSLQLEGCVTLKGFIPEDQLVSYYQSADLVVMPTLALEGFGLPIVEALACGTMVLGTRVGAIPEILSRIDPRLLSEGTDSHSLAEAVRNVVAMLRDDPAGRDELVRKGLELVQRAYNWEKHCEKLENIVFSG